MSKLGAIEDGNQLYMIAVYDSITLVNTKHRKTITAIFTLPTSASILFSDIESLVKALGGGVLERGGSRVKIELKGEQWRCHRPHPGKEAKRYQVEEVRELLERIGMQP
uniref:HicA toxin of toxin-antitoxin n=1 Tax=Candidatus Kentrum sp. MB TaxID=2138164 RepID=A0A450XFL1_9GAMM|nr:MAG: HicA toxin of toxin-antitoxin [Candidatus Kentron sp. MB]VFK29389.1 MAG: HicA toxin of toxin-antitoxin [Candidatus Kentron sp. MB]VFK74773.1 MAG: HicA toxin of toxin-antitoxin [Candidatus Kentron sp. MB]